MYWAHTESQLIVAGGSADLGWALPCVWGHLGLEVTACLADLDWAAPGGCGWAGLGWPWPVQPMLGTCSLFQECSSYSDGGSVSLTIQVHVKPLCSVYHHAIGQTSHTAKPSIEWQKYIPSKVMRWMEWRLPKRNLICCVLSRFSWVQLCSPRTVAQQSLLSMGFSRQEYWSGSPRPPPGDLPHPGTEPSSLMSPVGSLPVAPPGKPQSNLPQVVMSRPRPHGGQ